MSNKKKIAISAEKYRSLILDKMRAQIEAQRLQYDLAKRVSIAELASKGYWKMKYWKMKYWKSGSQEIGQDVINPAAGAFNKAKASKKTR